MQLAIPRSGAACLKVSAFTKAVRKAISSRKEKMLDRRLLQALEHLALAAPHILNDIGFQPDPDACSPDTFVWRRKSICVEVTTTEQSVSVSSPPASDI